MKKTIITIALVSLLALGGQVFAELCTIDAVPAATLLLPYFEVDLAGGDGVNTLFSVNNASAAPQLAHVVFWTDQSVPTLDFDIYLTGYDVQSVNLGDVFINGNLPITYYSNTYSNNGAFSAGHLAATAACDAQLPYTNPALNADFIAHIQAAHTGGGSAFFGGLCSGLAYGDGIARGYITIDQVLDCSLEFPSTAYFTNTAGFDNVLWGDYFYVDAANAFAQGDNLVHIEADTAAGFVAGDYTFYHRYVTDAGTDQREPLGTTYAARYLNGGAFSGGTSYICWRDSNIAQNPFACAPGWAPWYPLSLDQLVIFDEQENPDVPETPPISPAPPTTPTFICEAEATKSSTSFSPFNFGWMYMNFNTTVGSAHDPTHQAWVTAVMDASGLYSVGLPAIQLDTACVTNNSLCIGLGGSVLPCP